MSNETSEDPLVARRRALAEALHRGDTLVVTPTGEVDFKEEAEDQGVPNIEIPDGKLA